MSDGSNGDDQRVVIRAPPPANKTVKRWKTSALALKRERLALADVRQGLNCGQNRVRHRLIQAQ